MSQRPLTDQEIRSAPRTFFDLSFQTEPTNEYRATWTDKDNVERPLYSLSLTGAIADWILDEDPFNIHLSEAEFLQAYPHAHLIQNLDVRDLSGTYNDRRCQWSIVTVQWDRSTTCAFRSGVLR